MIDRQRLLTVCILLCMTPFAITARPALAAPPQAPTGLLCELSSEPLGLENPRPGFCWIVNDPDKDEVQSAYRIEVAKCDAPAPGQSQVVWDSGKVASAASSNVAYGGEPLAAGEVYSWRVKTWDKDGAEGPWSAPQRIVTALKERWTATPVWAAVTGNFALLRKEVKLADKKIARAIAYVTARDTKGIRQYVYKFYVNGALVGVGPTRGFGGKVPYNTFDVTALLKSGAPNALAAICGSTDPDKDFLCQVEILYADGTRQTVASDAAWKALDAARIYNMDIGKTRKYGAINAGPEDIDATKMPQGWLAAGFDDAAWAAATVKPAYKDALIAQPTRNLVLSEAAPVTAKKNAKGNLFFDFGKEIIGGVRLTLAGKAGQKIHVRLGEELKGPDEVRYELRAIKAYDETWTLREGEQTIENWGYRGFRYGEIVSADSGAIPEGIQVRALVMRYPFDDGAASFESSSPELNEVWALCKYSVKATALDVYQDCPTRERLPYEGDAYINQLSHYALDREYALARYSAEYLYATPTWPTEYKQLSVMQAREDYEATGNMDSLKRSYEILKTKTLEDKMNADGLVEKPLLKQGDLVDWPLSQRDGYDFQKINTVINAFNAKSLQDLAQIATALGKKEEAEAYAKKAELVRRAVNAKLYDAARGAYRDAPGSEHTAAHASFFPAAFGLVPTTEIPKVAAFLKGKGMACSVYGSQFLLEALYKAAEGEAALKLMTSKETNSWEHMIHDLGATIVTEAWDPAGKPNMSFAHAWASAPANIIPRYTMGIRPFKPGCEKMIICPALGGLTHAKIALPTIKGTVRVEVAKEPGKGATIKANLPANTTADILMPALGDGVSYDLTLDGAHVNEGFQTIGSGEHIFKAMKR